MLTRKLKRVLTHIIVWTCLMLFFTSLMVLNGPTAKLEPRIGDEASTVDGKKLNNDVSTHRVTESLTR